MAKGMKIGPSLAAAPLGNLNSLVRELEEAEIDYLHFDLEDGVFTPVMTLGTRIIAELRPRTNLPFDVHLMMVNPEWILEELAACGADRITVHMEACPYPRRVLKQIKNLGLKSGIAFNPATLLTDLNLVHDLIDQIILLSTEPEFPNCPFIPAVLNKISELDKLSFRDKFECMIDGGVSLENLPEIYKCRVESVVVGRYTFQGGKISENISRMRSLIEELEVN